MSEGISSDVTSPRTVPSQGLVRRGVVRLIRGYQQHLSPMKAAPSCRFTPTCSEYAAQAIARHGTLKGMWLASWRIARCNPLVAGGDDPVPMTFPAHFSRKIQHD